MTPDELRRFREGDPELFRELVRRESPRLLHYACHLARDRHAADELLLGAETGGAPASPAAHSLAAALAGALATWWTRRSATPAGFD